MIILKDLSDEELNSLTQDDFARIRNDYDKNGIPETATIKGLLKEKDIRYDDLSDFIQNFYVGRCNNANRTTNQIYISRKNSPIRDNIVINLNSKTDIPDITIQIQISDQFIHEEAYTSDGLLLYTL